MSRVECAAVKFEIRQVNGHALEAARAFARAELLGRALLHASLEQPALQERSRHWLAFAGERIVGVAAEIDGVFPFRSAPLAATLPGAASALLEALEPPCFCLAGEPLWSELARAGAELAATHLQMARLRRDPLPDPEPEPEIVTLDDPEELAHFYGPGFERMRHELGPFVGVREGGALIAAVGAEYLTDELAQLGKVRIGDSKRGSALARALVTRLVRQLETGTRRVVLQVREDAAPAIALFSELGFRGTRRLAKLRLDG